MASSSSSITECVVHAVASYIDTDPLELPPLYDTIDPDALDACINKMIEGEMTFRYAGQDVTVRSDGSVEINGESVDCSERAKPMADD